jgi:Uncharacterized protein conserved in bacteria (DUF2332)
MVEFGWINPILIDESAGILAGHGRLLAARKLGLTEVPVIRFEHLSEAQKRAYLIADTQLAVLEVGASAGLHLIFDCYRYDFGNWRWGADGVAPTIAATWEAQRPPDALRHSIACCVALDRRSIARFLGAPSLGSS